MRTCCCTRPTSRSSPPKWPPGAPRRLGACPSGALAAWRRAVSSSPRRDPPVAAASSVRREAVAVCPKEAPPRERLPKTLQPGTHCSAFAQATSTARVEEKCRNMASWSHQVLGRSSLRSHALPRCCCLWLCAERAGAHGGACARRVDGRREDGVRRRSRFKQPSCIPQLRRACAERSALAAPAWSSAWSRLVHTAHRVPDANPTLLRLPSR